mgnify:CR=1 FL=1
MNKLKEQLRFKMLGQLSDERTKEDIDNAYSVAVYFCLSFTSFLRENYSTVERWENFPLENNKWRCYGTDKEFTTEELLNKFLKEYETLD